MSLGSGSPTMPLGLRNSQNAQEQSHEQAHFSTLWTKTRMFEVPTYRDCDLVARHKGLYASTCSLEMKQISNESTKLPRSTNQQPPPLVREARPDHEALGASLRAVTVTATTKGPTLEGGQGHRSKQGQNSVQSSACQISEAAPCSSRNTLQEFSSPRAQNEKKNLSPMCSSCCRQVKQGQRAGVAVQLAS